MICRTYIFLSFFFHFSEFSIYFYLLLNFFRHLAKHFKQFNGSKFTNIFRDFLPLSHFPTFLLSPPDREKVVSDPVTMRDTISGAAEVFRKNGLVPLLASAAGR